MAKVGRNDPCPCGSGKKYKKCHGKSNLIEFPSKRAAEDLEQYFLQFQAYMRDYYPYLFPSKKPASEEEEVHSFIRLLYKGMFMPQKGGATVYQRFLRKTEKKISRSATEMILKDWETAKSSIYKMTGVDPKGFVYVRDLLHEETYKVDRTRIPLKDEDLDSAPYYTGILLNWGDFYRFSPMAVPIEPNTYEIYQKKLEKGFQEQTSYRSLSEYFHETFLEEHLPLWIYSEEKLNQQESNREESDTEIAVIEILKASVDQEVVKDGSYKELTFLWEEFYKKKKPALRKPEVMAAALEYFYYQSIHPSTGLSQKDIAQKYGVSPTSLSKWNTELESFTKKNNKYIYQ
ncbi:SEC-C metal-binding domain-containing protein [Halobacillus sp. Marseille-Q1614]|uniref:SEC-C metal-binding domain-containing protein n=1 Tax=Halobacillus sp. Marseille-Q1614 TaxID=2709134 RepID=UPI00157101B0|nr:SEC-C metal-binding domain-containing protein [Halobacillus sp. Marseille-Q1614]